MARLVNTKALMKRIDRYPPYIRDVVIKELRYVPTVDPVNRGHWERYLNEGLKWRCSECASRFTTPFNYCPHCGAKMTLD